MKRKGGGGRERGQEKQEIARSVRSLGKQGVQGGIRNGEAREYAEAAKPGGRRLGRPMVAGAKTNSSMDLLSSWHSRHVVLMSA